MTDTTCVKHLTAVVGSKQLLQDNKVQMLLTLKSANVLTQYVASSTVSSSVTWMRPYVSVPLVGQYWSHFTCSGEKYHMRQSSDWNILKHSPLSS